MYVSIFRILNTDTREPRYLYLESRARILGNQDIYMREGSAVELECGIENIPAPPAYIYWYKVGFMYRVTNKDFNELIGIDFLLTISFQPNIH